MSCFSRTFGFIGFFAFAALSLLSIDAAAQVAATQKSSEPPVKPYGSIDMRHHINTYYDDQGEYNRQEPSVHTRMQLGAQLYEGRIDFYGTLGAYKRPLTQQIQQRKPELALDYYPVKSDMLTFLVYNIVQFPVRNSDYRADEEREEDNGDGTTYIFGMSPTMRFRSVMQVPRIDLKFGLDGWTKMYSRKQYTGEYIVEDEGEGYGSALTTNEEEIEDTAMHYKLQGFAGMSFNTLALRDFLLEVTTHYQSDFKPIYERSEDSVEYRYGATRFSFFKARLNWDLSPRVSFANDFYQYYDGLFDEKRQGVERRFRNVARLTCKL